MRTVKQYSYVALKRKINRHKFHRDKQISSLDASEKTSADVAGDIKGYNLERWQWVLIRIAAALLSFVVVLAIFCGNASG